MRQFYTEAISGAPIRPQAQLQFQLTRNGNSIYQVKSGDTLSQIARDNDTTVAVLMSLNNDIANADVIRVGQKIISSNRKIATAKYKFRKFSMDKS